MAINQNNGNDGDFDEDIFDGEDMNDQDFDAENFDDNDFAENADLDSDLSDEEFDGGDWADDEATQGPAAKQKSLYQTREKKGLSFNTIVIIGAVVVGGGVMMMTIMNKSAQVSAGTQNVFQSMLSMVGVMDGELSGPKESTSTDQQQGASSETGFLSDPSIISAQISEEGTPPQPVPMAPEEAGADINEPLTPLPEDLYAGTPRGPEESLPVEQTPENVEAPVVQPALTAEDILKQAQANREKKLQAEAAIEPVPAEPIPVAEEKPDVQVADILAQEKPAPAAVAPTPAPVTTEASASSDALSANTKALEGVTSGLDALMKRMERMEGDITAVREANQSQYQEMEKTIASLKGDVNEIKARPAPKQVVVEKPSLPDVVQEKVREEVSTASDTSEKVAAPAKKVAKKVKPAVAQKAPVPAASSASWELRAAQPGRAWVSRAGQRDMQGIEVGQTLPGLGRVTAITYQNGRWSVMGTQGSIQQ